MLFRAALVLAQIITLQLRGTLAVATFLEGFFSTNQSPFQGQVYELCYGVKSMGNIVSLANKETTTCEHLGGLSFWQAQRETPNQYLNPEYEYFSFDTIGGESIVLVGDKKRAALKVGRLGTKSQFHKAIFSPMIPKKISGGSRGIRSGDHLVLFGSMDRPGQYKLEGTLLTDQGDEPKGVFYTTRTALDPMTMTLRVAPNPEQAGQGNLPIYEESDETDGSDDVGVPTYNPTTETWEWAGPNQRTPDTMSTDVYEDIAMFSPEDSDAFIEQADWSTSSKRYDYILTPPAIIPKDPFRLSAGYRYPQPEADGYDPQTDEILQISDVQISPYQNSEEASRLLGDSDITDRILMNSPEETTLDTSGSQLNLGSVSYTPTAYGNEINAGFDEAIGMNTQQRWAPPQPVKGISNQPVFLKSATRRKAGNTGPILPWPVADERNST
ncbi:hypothetical protein TWF569_008800 [Orbilia oligospora]|nr:hypothetical protein TWF569_008800 [Orbilia oligospora]